jgi:hypothetical protein
MKTTVQKELEKELRAWDEVSDEALLNMERAMFREDFGMGSSGEYGKSWGKYGESGKHKSILY